MLELDAPVPLVGDLLEEQLYDAALVTDVHLVGDKVVLTRLDETQREAAQAVVSAHSPTAQFEADQFVAQETNKSITTAQVHDAIAANKAWRTNTWPQVISGADAIISPVPPATSTAKEKQLAQGIKTLANQVAALCQQNNALARSLLDEHNATD